MHKEITETARPPGGVFLNSRIPYLSDIEKMGLYREPVVCYRPRSVAAQSYERANAAVAAGRFKDEIVPVSVPQRKGDPRPNRKNPKPPKIP